MTIDFTDMTDEELYTLIDDAKTELGKRQTRDVFDQQVNELYESARTAGAITAPEQGEQWKQPTHAGDAYAKGDVVTHDNKQWVSTVTPNVWEPGVSGWREHAVLDPETGEPQYPDYNPPTGAHDAYNTGERITWNGQVYEATQDGVVWSPEEYPPAWNLVTGDEEPEDEDTGDEEPEDEDTGDEEPVDDEGDTLPAWQPDGHAYTVGDQFDHEGTPYRVLQDHTSQPHWTPDVVASLYERGAYKE